MQIKKTLAVSVAAIVSIVLFHVSNASAFSCEELFVVDPAAAEAPVDLPFDLKSGIGARGFLKAFPYDAAQEARYARHNVTYWGIEVYVLPTVEAARAHDKLAKSAAWQGVYLIDPLADTSAINLQNVSIGKELYDGVLANKPFAVSFVFPKDGNLKADREMQVVPAERVARDFATERITLRRRGISMGPHFWLRGYAFPEALYGKFVFADLWGSSRTIKNLKSRARALEREGVTFEFSPTKEQFRGDLELAIKTQRRDQDTREGAYFSDPKDMNMALDAFDRGDVFTIRGVKNGKSQGGIIVFRNGNHLDFRSTFYTEEGGILYAQIAAMYFFRRLERAGINELYIDMVSTYSQGLKGQLTSIKEAQEYTEELMSRPPVPYDFRTPLGYADFER